MRKLLRILPAMFLTLIILSISVFAQTELVSLRDIFKDPKIEGNRPVSGSFSPSGKWIVYKWTDTETDTLPGLYRVPASGGSAELIRSSFKMSYRWMENGDDAILFSEKGSLKKIDIPGNEESTLAEKITIPQNFYFSPDGEKLAFSNKEGIWIINVDGTELTKLSLNSGSSLRWSEDGDYIFYVKDSNVWRIDEFTRKITKITDEPEEHGQSVWWYYYGGIRRFNVSPDGKYLSYTKYKSNTPEREIIVPHYVGKKYVWPQRARNSFPDDPYGESSLMVTDIENEITREIDLGTDKEFRIRTINWSPDGSRLHVVILTADNHDQYQLIVDPDKGTASIIDHEHDDAWIGGPGFSSFWDNDGKNIIFTSERSGYNHLWMVSANGGDPVQLTMGDWELENVEMTEDGKSLVYQSTEGDPAQRQIYRFDLNSRKTVKITSAVGMKDLRDVSDDGEKVLYLSASTLRPADYFAAEVNQNATEIQVSSTVPDEFNRVPWVKPEFIWFKNHNDGTPIYAMRYDPPNLDRSKKYPAVIFVHGAGYIQNTIKGWATYSPNIKFHTRLAQKGYVVLDLDYRGSQGYGRDFRTDVYMHLGGKDLEDEVAGVEYLKTLGYVDTGFMGIYGGSYGGFMTLMALFLEPDVFKAGAALRSVTDWENYNAGYTQQRLGRVSENKEAYIRSSPIHHAEHLKGQLLLMHGLIDDNVFAQDTFQLSEKLIELGKTDLFECMIYPSQRHGFTDPDSWIDEYRRIELLFDRYLMSKMGMPVIDDYK